MEEFKLVVSEEDYACSIEQTVDGFVIKIKRVSDGKTCNTHMTWDTYVSALEPSSVFNGKIENLAKELIYVAYF